MWYEGGMAWGIRRCFYDKKQAFQLGGKSCGVSKENLESIVVECIRKMEDDNLSEEGRGGERRGEEGRGGERRGEDREIIYFEYTVNCRPTAKEGAKIGERMI